MFFGHNSDFSELWTVSSSLCKSDFSDLQTVSSLVEEGTGEDETGFV